MPERMGRAPHIRDAGGGPNARDNGLNIALAKYLAILADKDALLVWLFGLPKTWRASCVSRFGPPVRRLSSRRPRR
jgi:hypothetical protein